MKFLEKLFGKKTQIQSPLEEAELNGPRFSHIDRQRKNNGPFYCGTAFCGHRTIKAAKECWQAKCHALEKIREEAEILRKQGKIREALDFQQAQSSQYYPERDSRNWPVNRSSCDMQREFIERTKNE